MSDESANSETRVPRPASLAPDDVAPASDDFDTTALLISVQDELDQAELVDPTGRGQRAVHFEAERLAVEYLRERDRLEVTRQRAAWFEREAALAPDASTKARWLLLASEHYAALAEPTKARLLAAQARAEDDDFALRQERQLARALGDLEGVRRALADEAETARTAAGRAHAAFYLGEIERLALDSASQAVHYLDLGQRSLPGDPRAPLFKLARQLGQSARAPSLKWPEGKEVEPLRFASSVIGRLRSDRSKGANTETDEPLVAFVEAQLFLGRGKPIDAGRALVGLFLEPEFGPAARWLSATLLAPNPDSRKEAVAALGELLDIAPTAVLRRALAARSLEAGDTEAAAKALFEDDGEEPAFDVIERLSLGALLSLSYEQLLPGILAAAKNELSRPFAWSIARALGGSPDFPGATTATARAKLRLADVMARMDPAELARTVPELAVDLPHDARLDLLALEVAHAEGRTRDLAAAIASHASGHVSALAHYAAGLLLERSGDTGLALEHYRSALGSDVFGEAALRALQALSDGKLPLEEAVALGRRLTPGEQREALFADAALELLRPSTGAGPQVAALEALNELLRANPDSAVGALLDERRWALEGNDMTLVERVSLRAEAAKSRVESALLHVRLWGLSPNHDSAPQWVARALEEFPSDPALVTAYERGQKLLPGNTARLREGLVSAAKTPWSRARLWLEAALYYELAGAHADAARAARQADNLAASEIARQCFVRNALLCDEAVVIKEGWVKDVESAPDPARLGILLRLFELERTRNQPESERQWLEEAQALAPERIDLLVELENLLLRQKKSRELLPVETDLCDLLPAPDRVAHAKLAARRERVQKGWSAAYAALSKADEGTRTSLFVLRQLQAQARRSGDDSTTLSISERLIERASYDNDKVILGLRAAEAALRLGQKEKAETLVSDALRILPGQVLLHHFRSTTLRSEDPVQAAIASENLAKGSHVPKHQAEAWCDAADLWTERVKDPERALAALRKAAEADPTNDQVFIRLLEELRRRDDSPAILELLGQRLTVVTDPNEQSELRLLQSRLLAESNDEPAARQVLEQLLAERPDLLLGWRQLAQMLGRGADPQATERAWLQVARLSSDRNEQASAYFALGKLYQTELDNPERAERCYRDVLVRRPDDAEARSALLPVYLQQRQFEMAKRHLTETLAALPDEVSRRRCFLDYVVLVERVVDDRAHLGELLDQALDLWPLEPEVIAMAARYYARVDPAALRQLDENTSAEVSRKLAAGFLEPRYLEAVAKLSEALGDLRRTRLLHAMAAALSGQLLRVPPLLGQSMQRTLDEQLAPAPMVSPLRTLLMLTRGVLEHSFTSSGPAPTPQRADTPLVKRVRTIAAQAAVPAPVVCLSAASPYGCWLDAKGETQLVFGERLHEDASNEELDFLIWRNMKLLQARAGVFTRLDPAQSKLAIVAFLSCFVDVNLATDWDTAEFEQIKARISPLIPADLDDDVPILALDALRSLTKSGEHLALAARKWANRTALLATGNINAALSALTRLTGQSLASQPALRLRQLADNPETRDLVGAALLPALANALPER